jgi:hypothetical protein
MKVLDNYTTDAPSHQAILDLFQGEWSSKMPAESKLVTVPGNAALFEDPRVHWAIDAVGGVADKTVLELGPLEGAHTYMLHMAGAKKITSIEANTKAFLKCLCVKEIFSLNRANFLLGDFVPFLHSVNRQFDVCLASGVLYHMTDPLLLLDSLSKVADSLVLWTHYYDKMIAEKSADRHRFEEPEIIEWREQNFTLHKRHYGEALDWGGFCGGSKSFAKWMTRDGILTSLKTLGYSSLKIAFETRNHPHGPCFAVCAQK